MSGDSHNSYVDRVREDTQRYVHKLLSENEHLKLTVAALDAEMNVLRQELAQREHAERHLQEVVRRIRTESEQYVAQYAAVEMHNTNLANLYVASYQLHGTLRREAVLAAMQEIIVNLIGSEHFAICEVEGESLAVLASMGLGPAQGMSPRVSEVVRTGTLWIGSFDRPDSREPLVCIPLKTDGSVIGVIAIFALLPHKEQLEPLDHELFDLLGSHAATALYCTSLQGRSDARIAS